MAQHHLALAASQAQVRGSGGTKWRRDDSSLACISLPMEMMSPSAVVVGFRDAAHNLGFGGSGGAWRISPFPLYGGGFLTALLQAIIQASIIWILQDKLCCFRARDDLAVGKWSEHDGHLSGNGATWRMLHLYNLQPTIPSDLMHRCRWSTTAGRSCCTLSRRCCCRCRACRSAAGARAKSRRRPSTA